jgi:hypothetical protein
MHAPIWNTLQLTASKLLIGEGAMKLMKLATVVVAGMLVCGGLGGSAGAKGGKEAKTVFLDTGVNCSAELPGDNCLYSGVIGSENKKCIEGRKVKMYAFVNGGADQVLVDTGTTSERGGFGGMGIPSDVSAAKFKVTESQVGNVTCKGKKFVGA